MSTDAIARGTPDPRARGALFERASFAFVLLVWVECVVASQAFIAWCASKTPVADDLALFYVKAQGYSFWHYLWSLHNEHRLPLPKILQYALYDWTGDIRSGMYLQAQIYAAIALACILGVRRLRGGSRPWDVLFPLMWLQIGNSENLLMGFQIGIALPGACVTTLLFCSVLSPNRLWPSRAWPSGLALLALPLCGGGGLLQTPFLLLYSAWLGFTNRNHPEPRERRGARVYLGCALATLVLVGLYLVHYERPPEAHYSPRGNPPWKLGLADLTAPFGPEFFSWHPLATPAVALGAAFVAWLFLRRALREREPRVLGTLAVLAGVVLLIAGIALGRPINGPMLVADRYIPLPAPFYVALCVGGLVLLERRWREWVLGSACVVMLLALPQSIRYGLFDGGMRRQHDHELEVLVRSHASWAKIHAHYSKNFVLGMSEVAEWLLRYYAQNGLPPFDESSGYQWQPQEYSSFDTPPLEVRYLEPPVNRLLEGQMVCSVAPPTSFDFNVTPTDERFSCLVGVPQVLLRGGHHPGVRGQVVLRGEGQEPRVLGEIRLDPQRVESDRGMQSFSFKWPSGTTGVLQLLLERIPREDGLNVSDRLSLAKARVD
jgi:multisubunit Na+/H+ antiporter MnhB subunit